MKKILPLMTLMLVPVVAISQTIVNDSFADGNRANTGPLQADWWSSNSTSGNSIEAYTNQLGLVSGTSGRGIHGTFAPQTLAVGQTLTATLTFTTPATVALGGASGTSFKFALMDFNNAGLAADLSSSSSTANPLYVGQPGYLFGFDTGVSTANDIDFREHDVASATGRFLGTTGEWISMGSSPDIGYTWAANTEYVVVLSVTRTGADSMDLFASLSQGGGLIGSHSDTDASSIANNFGMIGIWANSNKFGSTNVAGEFEDNGVTFSNVTIEVVPEPSTYAFLVGLLALGFVIYRRR